ncbi:hypothetical protein G6F50_013052 [Rhizopus delemar]|uniref:Uncharacterized protein n=1 Tax=Rhizopus delemar TaxID=936053 RepID=A0A9P6YP93_9FUNG|nr:hypothetical protein G6F50_013052 [Rhizopus delemar]
MKGAITAPARRPTRAPPQRRAGAQPASTAGAGGGAGGYRHRGSRGAAGPGESEAGRAQGGRRLRRRPPPAPRHGRVTEEGTAGLQRRRPDAGNPGHAAQAAGRAHAAAAGGGRGLWRDRPRGSLARRQGGAVPLRRRTGADPAHAVADCLRAGQPAVHGRSAGRSLTGAEAAGAGPGRVRAGLGLPGPLRALPDPGGLSAALCRWRGGRAAPAQWWTGGPARHLPGRRVRAVLRRAAPAQAGQADHHGHPGRFPDRRQHALALGAAGGRGPAGRHAGQHPGRSDECQLPDAQAVPPERAEVRGPARHPR